MADCAWADYELLEEAEKQHVELLRSYLRIRTVHPTPAYAEVVEFLLELGREFGLDCERTLRLMYELSSWWTRACI